MAKSKKIRPLGDILLDIEPLLLEAMVDHDLQHGDMLGILYSYLKSHLPGHAEVYTDDGTSPVFYYAHHSGLNKKGFKKIKK